MAANLLNYMNKMYLIHSIFLSIFFLIFMLQNMKWRWRKRKARRISRQMRKKRFKFISNWMLFAWCLRRRCLSVYVLCCGATVFGCYCLFRFAPFFLLRVVYCLLLASCDGGFYFLCLYVYGCVSECMPACVCVCVSVKWISMHESERDTCREIGDNVLLFFVSLRDITG